MTNTNTADTTENMLATNTESLPVGTPVTICIGSDRYAGEVVRSTKRTCEVKYTATKYLENKTFRLTTRDARYYTSGQSHYLGRVGEAVQEMDPSH